MTGEVARFELLGPVRALSGDTELAIGPARQRAVLVVLASHPGQVVSRDELIRAVWGEPAPASAVSNLYSCIAGLRRVLGAEVLTAGVTTTATSTVGNGYVLNVEKHAVDARRFEQLYWRGKAAKDDRDAHEAFTQALRLWRGDALQKAPGSFAESERRRLTERKLATIEELNRVRLRRGEDIEVIAELEHVVRKYPEREVFRELLMLALARADRRAEALAVFLQTGQPGPGLRRIQALVLAGEEVAEEIYVESA